MPHTSGKPPVTIRDFELAFACAADTLLVSRLQHEPVGRSVGLSVAQLREIRLTPPFAPLPAPLSSLTPELGAALLFADFVTKSVKVPQHVFDQLHSFLNDTQMVDAVATVGGYNFVSRFVVALDVDSKMDVPVPIPSQ